jgi:hypothetical protein
MTEQNLRKSFDDLEKKVSDSGDIFDSIKFNEETRGKI